MKMAYGLSSRKLMLKKKMSIFELWDKDPELKAKQISERFGTACSTVLKYRKEYNEKNSNSAKALL